MIQIREIDHIVLRAVHLETMLRFYCAVLGCVLERKKEEGGLYHLRAGGSMIDHVPVDGKLGFKGSKPPAAEGRNVNHICLRVEPFNADSIRSHLKKHGIEAEAVSSRFGAESECPSICLNDRERNVLELKSVGGALAV